MKLEVQLISDFKVVLGLRTHLAFYKFDLVPACKAVLICNRFLLFVCASVSNKTDNFLDVQLVCNDSHLINLFCFVLVACGATVIFATRLIHLVKLRKEYN
jgi:hypothetical protein